MAWDYFKVFWDCLESLDTLESFNCVKHVYVQIHKPFDVLIDSYELLNVQVDVDAHLV